jgi:uncharacterized protein (TIGR00290 family)
MMNKKRAFCSWSGGKDSYLALNRALLDGYEITHLLTMFDETGERSRSHSVSLEVMRAQTGALGLELVSPSASWQDYETVFIRELEKLKARGIENAVFGDIDLQAHRDWEETVCSKAGIKAVLPLWNEKRLDLVEEFLNSSARSVVICVNEKFLPKEFCGRLFDRQFISDLPADIDACGENGEFHTFVFDGKLFKNPVSYKIEEVYQHQPVFPSGDKASFYYAKLNL